MGKVLDRLRKDIRGNYDGMEGANLELYVMK